MGLPLIMNVKIDISQHSLLLNSIGLFLALRSYIYTWRPYQVLKVIAAAVNKGKAQENIQFVDFHKEGEKKGAATKQQQGIQAATTDWQLTTDIGRHAQFSEEVADTKSCLDIVVWSRATKQVIMLELTVPSEECIEDAYDRKRAKYQLLVAGGHGAC